MEKIIEFRGKRKINGKWVYGYYVKMNGGSFIIDEKRVWNLVDDTTVGRYTGLKDVSGEKIYKDDILRVTEFDDDLGYITEVRDDRGVLVIDVISSDYDCTAIGWAFDNDMSGYDFKIIGNIHDKAQQKQALIDMMRGDEELGLYDE